MKVCSFNVNGIRARLHQLEDLYKSLALIPPTSVDCERAFSSLGLFVNKIRTGLNDASVDNLCFLRAHFKKTCKK